MIFSDVKMLYVGMYWIKSFQNAPRVHMDLSVKVSVETVKITDAMRTRASVRWAARVAGMETNVTRNVPHVVHLSTVTDIEDVQIV